MLRNGVIVLQTCSTNPGTMEYKFCFEDYSYTSAHRFACSVLMTQSFPLSVVINVKTNQAMINTWAAVLL